MAGEDPIGNEPNPGTAAATAGQSLESLFSPRFKSAAAMAGWDEESILVATLIVEDTPDRDFKQRKRSDPLFKTPPSNSSRRKRRVYRKSPMPIQATVLNLDEEEPSKEKMNEPKVAEKDEEGSKENSEASCSNAVLPCLDKLRDELSCAICLEICYEPSTTTCGHSFCKRCLRSAADKCGKKCPKCRQIISNGRSCTVNTVLWNTIQLLFPQDVEARKATAGALNSREGADRETPRERDVGNGETRRVSRGVNPSRQGRALGQDQIQNSQRVQRGEFVWLSSRDGDDDEGVGRRGGRVGPNEGEESALDRRVRRGEELARLLRREGESSSGRRRRTTARGVTSVVPSQDGDAALALRLQRQEFMETFREPDQGRVRGGLQSARENLRAMASRAVNVRSRGGQYL